MTLDTVIFLRIPPSSPLPGPTFLTKLLKLTEIAQKSGNKPRSETLQIKTGLGLKEGLFRSETGSRKERKRAESAEMSRMLRMSGMSRTVRNPGIPPRVED